MAHGSRLATDGMRTNVQPLAGEGLNAAAIAESNAKYQLLCSLKVLESRLYSKEITWWRTAQ